MTLHSAFLLLTTLYALLKPTVAQVTADLNSTVANVTNPDPSVAGGCQCGYYDDGTKNLFTEFTISYFNETETLSAKDFLTETYVHDYEKGWNTFFREAADPSNVDVSNRTNAPNSTTSLELYVEPYPLTSRIHIITGSSVRTMRQDMMFGSFTSLIRSPGKSAGSGGSTVSMELQLNLTQALTMNMQNTDKPATAYVGMLANEEFPGASISVPYGNMTNATWGNGTIDPWDYTELRMDWTKDDVKFYIGGKLARTILTKDNAALLSVPVPLYFKHWSNGNPYYSMGPPTNLTHANVGWTRMFFNSSLMTDDDHKEFDRRCHVSDACLVSDMTLRGSTDYPQAATNVWVQVNKPGPNRKFTIWIAVACAVITTVLLVQPVLKRIVDKYGQSKESKASKAAETHSKLPDTFKDTHDSRIWDSRAVTLAQNTPKTQTRAPSFTTTTLNGDTQPNSTSATPRNQTRRSSRERDLKFERSDGNGVLNRMSPFNDTELPPLPKAASHLSNFSLDTPEFGEGPSAHFPWFSENFSDEDLPEKSSQARDGHHDRIPSAVSAGNELTIKKLHSVDEITIKKRPSSDELTMTMGPHSTSSESKEGSEGHVSLTPSWPLPDNPVQVQEYPSLKTQSTLATNDVATRDDAPHTKTDALTNVPEMDKNDKDKKNLPQAKKRVDYLAGLVALSSLLVTGIHFSLTFVFADINAGAYTHYHSETVARKTIDSFLLNLIWIGPFLMTSTRFLVSSYLRNGELLPVAEKTVGRTPRLMIPIAAMVMLEYFFINAGATKWLEYLPSITWSDWPFTVGYTNFGNFLSEVIELMYLIPNAAPLVTFNYCTGVLWTIPVQLQGSWLSLLAVIVIREIKTPWKRFGFYAFCILNHWYALSWGSYFYLGIMLTDLDLTYKWRTYLYARPLIYYPFLTLMAATGIAGLFMDFLSQWTNVNYATFEYSIHPDINSGLPISQAGYASYPPYYVPRLNGIAFAAGFQAMVELSPAVQKVLSIKLFVFVFPHIFTIYLFHGFIFWSLGSFLCVHFSVAGLQYWLNLLLVAICCYATLAISLPLLTPVVEGLGKNITTDIWKDARDDPVPRQPTLYPFRRDLFLARYQTPNGNSKDMTITKIQDPEQVETHFNPELVAEEEGIEGRADGGAIENQEHGGSANRVIHLTLDKLKGVE